MRKRIEEVETPEDFADLICFEIEDQIKGHKASLGDRMEPDAVTEAWGKIDALDSLKDTIEHYKERLDLPED